jgi:hypothetical protein
MTVYPKVSGLSHNEINNTTTINTRWHATQRVMEVKLTRLTHKIALQLYLMVESGIICSSRSRWSVRKLLDTPSKCRTVVMIIVVDLWTMLQTEFAGMFVSYLHMKCDRLSSDWPLVTAIEPTNKHISYGCHIIVARFSKVYYHTSPQDPILSGASVACCPCGDRGIRIVPP